MDPINNSFEVYEKISDIDRIKWHLIIDAVYRADPSRKDMSAEVLSKLLGVKNQGGFRYLGKTENPNLVVLFTSGEDIYWKDELDTTTGLLLYYGDNKIPGNDLHKTNLHGNEILRYMFDLACSDDFDTRKKIPPVLVFKKNTSMYEPRYSGRDVKFLGLAVPGLIGKPQKDWLTAVWGCNRNGDRFQNYKAYFTVLDTSEGCAYEKGAGINLAWLNDIKEGNAYDSDYAPIEWKRYIKGSKIHPLFSRVEKYVKTKEEQLPSDKLQYKMLLTLQKHFLELDGGYSFEEFARDLTMYMDSSVVDLDTTRPYKDGGFDAEGRYRIFSKVENVVYVDFYLQAKCYNPETTGVRVTDTARLISRIKDRQFGIMFTTSYVANQAYQEIIEDGHPIIIINGRNIIEYIFNELEIRSVEKLKFWLDINYSSSYKKKKNTKPENVDLLVAESSPQYGG